MEGTSFNTGTILWFCKRKKRRLYNSANGGRGATKPSQAFSVANTTFKNEQNIHKQTEKTQKHKKHAGHAAGAQRRQHQLVALISRGGEGRRGEGQQQPSSRCSYHYHTCRSSWWPPSRDPSCRTRTCARGTASTWHATSTHKHTQTK